MEVDYSRQYRKWHDSSIEHAEAVGRAEYECLRPFVGADRQIKILDFGCGMGFALTGLKSKGYVDLTGIDADRSQVEAARSRGLNVELVPTESTVARLSAEKDTYDVIVCLDVLEHIPVGVVRDVVARLRECLKANGTFICRVPNCNSVVGTRYRYIDWTHVVSFSEHSLDFLLYHAGFKDISVLEQPDPIAWRPGALVKWVARRVLRFARRLEFAAEIGVKEGMAIPMSPNVVGVARNV